MNTIEAAYQVLREAKEPLHYREIARRMLEQGLWITTGKTPHDSVYSRILVDMQKHGSESRFCRPAPGMFGLNDGATPQLPPKPKPASTLSFTDAAEEVLQKHGRRSPMHYREITERAIESGLIVTEGKTPEATMNAQLGTEIDRQSRRGERPRFVKHGRGYFGLSRWMGQGLAFQIEQHNRRVREQLLQRVRNVDAIAFEALVGDLLTVIGFDSVEVTSASGDGGIDVRGTLVVGEVIRTRMAVQVKRWKNNVQAPTVQQVRGSLGAHEQGLIITTSDFSSGAKAEAERADATPAGLMNGEQFVNLMIEHDIGIHRASHDIIELGEEEGEE
jgi:restriction system protein